MKNKFIIEQLEQRLMLSADFLPVPFDGGLPHDEFTTDLSVVETPLLPSVFTSDNADNAELQRHELVFIDSRVPEYQKLVDDIMAKQDKGTHFDIVVLDSDRNGIEQISGTLNKYANIDAVHLFSHGSDGTVQLGSTWLSNDTLDIYADSIEGWKNSLTENADLLFYGCNVAAGNDGQVLVESLSILTGADIAASDDLTGVKKLGGDWKLEVTSGHIETVELQATSLWYGVLDTMSVNAAADTYIDDGNQSNNYGMSPTLTVDHSGGGIGAMRILLQFDLSSIPAGSTITQANIKMSVLANTGPFDINIYEVTEAWDEGSETGNAGVANWDESQAATNWTTAGGTYDPTILDTLNTASLGNHSWDITSLVQDWYSGTKVNNGIIIGSPDGGGNSVTYESRETANPPELEITYTPPPDISVNSTTAGQQENTDVATDAAGNFVVVWESEGQDGDAANETNIYARMYDSSGIAVTGEFLVNQTPAASQFDPQIAMDDAGNFVITWASQGQDGDAAAETNIYARVYDSAGTAVTGEFLVNQTTVNSQVTPSVAMDGPTGEFMIAWAGFNGSDWNIHARRFDVSGTPLDNEITVNTTTAGDQVDPDVDVDSYAEFGVAWTSYGQDGDSAAEGNIYVQNYMTGGATRAGEILANTTTAGNQHSAALAKEDDGDYTVVWVSEGQDGDGGGIFADNIAFGSGNNRIGEFQVNATSAGNQSSPDVAVEPLGNIVFTWESTGQDGDGPAETNVYARLFNVTNAAVSPVGSEILVNTITSGDQGGAAVAADDEDDFVVAWSGNGAGDSEGVFAQVFEDMLTNIAPKVSLANSPLTYIENNPPVIIDAGLTISDPDDMNLAGAIVSILDGFTTGQDILSFTDQLGITGNYDSVTGILTLTGPSSVANYQTALRTVTYHNTSEGPDTTQRLISVTVDDGVATTGDMRKLNITAQSDPASITGTSTAQPVNDNATISPFSGVTIGYVDNPAQTLTVTVTLDAAAKGQLSNLGGFVEAPLGTYTFTGTAAESTTAIRGLLFTPTANRVAPTSTETITFTISADDGGGPVTDSSTTVVSTSINDPATITGTDTGNITENVDPDTDGLLETAGSLNVSDPDTGESQFAAGTTAGTYGSITIDAAGSWSYAADKTQLAIQQLAAGSSMTDTIAITSEDGTSHNIVITINGANNTPSIGGVDTGSVTEDVDPDADGLLETSGTLTITDTDSGESQFAAGTTAGAYGSITIDAAGNWSYAADKTQLAIQQLAAGSSMTDTIAVTSEDGTSHNIVITINGANNTPSIGGVDTGSVTEDVDPDADGLLETSGTLTITDTDTGESQFAAGTTAGAYGSITIDAAGSWSYAADKTQLAIQQLAAGSSMTDTIAITSEDGTSHNIVITINGANNTPSIGGVDTGSVTEDVDPDADGLLETSGTLTITDTDSGESQFAAGTTAGAYGSITIDAAGSWSYAADKTQLAIQQLTAGSSLTDTIAVTSEDGTSHNIVITINGANNVPTVSLSADDTGSEDMNKVFTHAELMSLINANDIDVDDTLFITISNVTNGTINLSGGTGGAGTTFTFIPDTDFFGNINFDYQVSDNNGASSALGTASIALSPVGDTPQVSNTSTLPDTITDPIVISPNTNDGVEITHFQISGISNGVLYHADGTTPITNGDYITLTQAQDGLKFRLTSNTAFGSFDVRPSKDGNSVDPNSGSATSIITVLSSSAVPGEDTIPDTEIEAEPEELTEEIQEDTTEDINLLDESITNNSGSVTSGVKSPEKNSTASVSSSATNSGKGAIRKKVKVDFKPIMERLSSTENRDNDSSNVLPLLSLKQQLNTMLDKLPIFRTSYENLKNSLDDFRREADMEMENTETVIGSAIAVSTGLSVGYVVWVIRGGMLISSLMSSMPAWQLADPLPILKTMNKNDEDDDESLESIIKNTKVNDDKKEQEPEPSGD